MAGLAKKKPKNLWVKFTVCLTEQEAQSLEDEADFRALPDAGGEG